MPTIVLAMRKCSVILISLFFVLPLFDAPLTNQIDSPLSSFSSSSNNPMTATASTAFVNSSTRAGAGAGVPNSSTRDKDIGAPTTSHNSKRRSNTWIIILAIVIGIFILLLLQITYCFCRRRRVQGAGAGVPNSSTRDKDIGAPTTSHNSKSRSNAWIIFLVIVSILLLLLLITYLFCRRRRVQAAGNIQELQAREDLDDLRGQLNNCQEFSLATVREATQNFSIENKLGQGGFGPVFKGTLANGTEIAVKRLESTPRSGQGIKQFKNEVISISKLQHRNIVQLLGYCFEENEKLLIYEFMLNKSLDVHLFDSTAPLDWKTRKKIIDGIARAILYMHEDSRLKIIHGDIKTSNVLLDHVMDSKISDLGLARLLKDNQSEANTTRIVGTLGFMAPEYCMRGVISPKIDVYSFGVVLLEIISGRRNPADDLGLLGSAWALWDKGTPLELMDEVVAQSCDDTKEVLRCIQIGLLCVKTIAEERPSMSYVRRMLENEIIIPEPTKPQFYGSLTNLPEASQRSALGSVWHYLRYVWRGAVNQLN